MMRRYIGNPSSAAVRWVAQFATACDRVGRSVAALVLLGALLLGALAGLRVAAGDGRSAEFRHAGRTRQRTTGGRGA